MTKTLKNKTAIKAKPINDERPIIRRCHCCGKSEDNLKPFDKEKYPSLYENSSADIFLYLEHRFLWLPDEKYTAIMADENFNEKYDLETRKFIDLLANPPIEKFALCQDCVFLSTDEFYQKLHEDWESQLANDRQD